jgi:hypothetical protein
MPGYPDELWAIVWESLLPQSDDRFKDAAVMARDLDAFVAGSKGSAAAMGAELEELLEKAFPGERVKREAWVRDAMGQQDPR